MKTILRTDKIFSEEMCLKVVFVFCVLNAPFALFVGIHTHSTSLLLVGVLCAFDAFTSFITLIVFKLLLKAPSQQYPFGYFKFEPLLIVIESTIIIVTCIVSILHALKDLYHQSGFLTNHSVGIYYLLIVIFIDLLMCIYIYICRKKSDSPLLEIEYLGWFYDLLSTFALLGGFVSAYFLAKSSHVHLQHLAVFVDPVMAFIIVLVFIVKPFLLFSENVKDILDRKPEDSSIEGIIVDITNHCAHELHIKINITFIKIRRAGRVHFCILKYSVSNNVGLNKITLLNNNIEKTLQDKIPQLYLGIIPESSLIKVSKKVKK
ncbi:MAG: cation transporter [Alphaproteobacteria bacterium]|nr:cation transporter [Alphaproteobacteria bacterium]